MKILSEPDVEKAMAILHQKGDKRIVVTSTNLSANQAKLFVYSTLQVLELTLKLLLRM